MIEVEGVVMSFGGFTAVNDCTLSVEAGSITGLIGPNGAGKTTLFNVISGATAPTRGEVRLNGRRVTGLKPHQLVSLGLVRTFQIPKEFSSLTVLENLMVPPPGQTGARLWAAWLRWRTVAREESALRDRAERVLDFLGLTQLAAERAGALSGGQKKLLELGRAMMSGAKVVLLDEPAAGVNRTLMRALCARIATLRTDHGYTFFVIEHDMNVVAELCDTVIVMAHGQVLTQGPLEEIRGRQEVIEAYLGARQAAAIGQAATRGDGDAPAR